MGDIAVKLENVSKYYKLYETTNDRLKEALSLTGKSYHKKYYSSNNISLDIKKGEVLGIIGKNGSGKSTLLKLIAGVLLPNNGKIIVHGKVSAILELGSGFNPEFSGMQNIFFYGTVLGLSRKEIEGKLESIIGFADIGEFIHQKLKTYSSGMKSRLGFAVALSVDPDILIIDEVLAVGDVQFQKKCYNKIHDLFSNGKTVIFVSHNSQAIVQFCNRAILLEDGTVINEGMPKDILALYEKRMFSKPRKENKANVTKQENQENVTPSLNECGGGNSNQSNPHLARIFGYHIVDINGDDVTELEQGRVYTIKFKVKYFESINDVALGVQIRDIKGLFISGANTWDYQKQIIDQVQTNEVLNVKWQFKCLLVPGAYTAALSSSSISSRELIKIMDAITFKVKPDKKVNGGIVNLEQNIVIERNSL